MLPLTTLVLAAAAGASPVLRAERVDKPPVVDGSLDDAAWKKATASSKFTQKLPDDGKAPSEPTHVRIVYDDKAIYIAVDCIQKTSEIVAPLSRRDREVETDSVTVALATRGDGTTAFEFSINPAGVLADATRFDDTSSSRDWDENWTGSAKKTATGWSAEIEIPLRILRFEERAEQSFGLQVRRYTSARKESDEWAHIPRSDSGEVSKYGRLENLVGLKKGSAFEVRPFVVGKIGSRDTDLAPLSRGFSPGFSAGADFKWLLLPSLTLDGAILPDFGQVEADKVVLNLSSFETYIVCHNPDEEKRQREHRKKVLEELRRCRAVGDHLQRRHVVGGGPRSRLQATSARRAVLEKPQVGLAHAAGLPLSALAHPRSRQHLCARPSLGAGDTWRNVRAQLDAIKVIGGRGGPGRLVTRPAPTFCD
jgi:hypothetical protein